MLRLIFISVLLTFVYCGYSSNTKITTDTSFIESMVFKNKKSIEIALTFLNSYVDNCNKMKESIGLIEWVSTSKLTTTRFKTELKRMIEEAYKINTDMGLEADPIFDAQDYPDKGFEIDSFDSTTNFLVVKGLNWPEFKLTIKMVNENEDWLVDGCGIINIPNDKRATR